MLQRHMDMDMDMRIIAQSRYILPWRMSHLTHMHMHMQLVWTGARSACECTVCASRCDPAVLKG